MRLRSVLMLSSLLPVCLLFSGCTILNSRDDIQALAKMSRIEGRVSAFPETNKPIAVFLGKAGSGYSLNSLAGRQVIYQPSKFAFLQPPGEYNILAFEDANEDLTLQQDERVGWYGDTTPIKVSGDGADITDLTVVLRTADEARVELPELFAPTMPAINFDNALPYFHLGEVVPLDNPRFSQGVGELGMWEPVKFFQQYGAGIFFLEPYDSNRTPILFVHGVGGYPQNFRYLIDQLDKTRYQPWILHYPSGLRLTQLSGFFAKRLTELQLRYGFPRIHIVAHSMGGLVARDAINQLTRQRTTFVDKFVTISTPWEGHPGSRIGIDRSPESIITPCWYDMAPGSPFLRALQETPLPDSTQYYLFFGHKGDKAMFAGESTDGALPLSSMANLDMQDAAQKVFSFNETHISILSSPEVARRLNKLFDVSKELPSYSGLTRTTE